MDGVRVSQTRRIDVQAQIKANILNGDFSLDKQVDTIILNFVAT